MTTDSPLAKLAPQFASNAASSSDSSNALEVPALASTTENSLNWSGYVATGGRYTSVSGEWRVPTVTKTGLALAADATWVGVGGVSKEDLVQAGTQAIEQDGEIYYQAWYEVLPGGPSQEIPLPVEPGDEVSVSLVQTSDTLWKLDFKNTTTGKTYELEIPFTSSNSSAEWIQEMPSLGQAGNFIPLSDFGTVHFTGGTTTDDGQTLSIAESVAEPLSMITRSGSSLAEPTILSDGGFAVTRSEVASVEVLERRSRFIFGFPAFLFSF
jgi:hypothetical protein